MKLHTTHTFTNRRADLIVLAGTAANEAAAGGAADFAFCPGRSDALDGKGTEFLAPRKYVNATVAFKVRLAA